MIDAELAPPIVAVELAEQLESNLRKSAFEAGLVTPGNAWMLSYSGSVRARSISSPSASLAIPRP